MVLSHLLKASKAIYLDCDILVFRNLAELYDLSFTQSALLAAVPDPETLTLADDSAIIASALGIPLEANISIPEFFDGFESTA